MHWRLLLAVCVSLNAAEPEREQGLPGRYLVVASETRVFRVDTCTGKTWMLERVGNEKLSAMGWTEVHEDALLALAEKARTLNRVAEQMQNILDTPTQKPKVTAKPVK